MHSLLESYLAEVRAKLGALPMKWCEEELREMRQHLLSALEANQKLGQTEDEAAANALAAFGSPKEAAKSVLWAWNRDARKKSWQSFLTIAGIWTACYAFEGFRSHSITWLWCWVASTFIAALLIVLPSYLLETSDHPLMSRRTK